MVKVIQRLAFAGALALLAPAFQPAAAEAATTADTAITYRSVEVEGLDIFYREAGPADAPTILLLHGFPTSSHMFRDLIPDLAAQYHVIAPDYPGFGHSSTPDVTAFNYTFAHLADVMDAFTQKLGLSDYVLYMQDYGGPVGIRLAIKHPDKVRGIVVQNAVLGIEGWHPRNTAPLQAYWKSRTPETEQPVRGIISPAGTKEQYVIGSQRVESLNPDSWIMAQAGLDRPANDEIQLELLYQYRDNVAHYPEWQAFVKKLQPPMLVVWGKGDPVFTLAGRDLWKALVPDAEMHTFDAGHFALETHEQEIAAAMLTFLDRLD
jgi:pimeloyl-ACP methyl ester carboxylesterase